MSWTGQRWRQPRDGVARRGIELGLGQEDAVAEIGTAEVSSSQVGPGEVGSSVVDPTGFGSHELAGAKQNGVGAAWITLVAEAVMDATPEVGLQVGTRLPGRFVDREVRRC